MIQCIGCKSFSFKRGSPADARQGKGHCEHRAPFVRHQAMEERDCEQYKPEADEVIKARVNWLNAELRSQQMADRTPG